MLHDAMPLIQAATEEAFRSQGLGTRLVDAFVRWSRERDAEVVEGAAFAANARAVALYEHAGLRPTLAHLEKLLGPAADAAGGSHDRRPPRDVGG
jgi:GNAT superfamily N-acetyltransferase